jgi:predicted AlkP superfamily phosphohydrolase/phosphomutase
MSRFALIGLDSAPPGFVFDQWRDELRNIGSVMRDGIHGVLRGAESPCPATAWTSMMTSQDPGQLGIYGGRVRPARDYAESVRATSEQVRPKTVWNHLSKQRLNSLVLGLPLTHPPKPMKGILASGTDSPGKEFQWTHPREAAREVDEGAGGEYMLDVPEYGAGNKDWLLEQVYEGMRRRFAAFRHFARKKEFDFMVLVEPGPDRIQQAFWRFADGEHRLHEAGHRHATAIHDYYVFLDEELGRLLNDLPVDTSVMVVSAGGARRSEGAFCINEWLRQEKLLVLKEQPEEPADLAHEMVDWGKTRAWAEGGYAARVYLNVKGREPKGAVPEAEADSFREELRGRLAAIPADSGIPIGATVRRPEEAYRVASPVAPDLLVFLGEAGWRASGMIGTKALHLPGGEPGDGDTVPARDGILAWDHPAKVRPKKKDPYSAYDVAPTILRFFNMDIPAQWIGEPLF